LRWVGLSGADAEDALQDVFLVAHRRGGFVPGAAQPTTWLLSIALNVARSRRRWRRNRREDPPLTEENEQLDCRDPERRAEALQALALVDRALDALPLEQRMLVILFDIEGRTYEEIAEISNVSLSTLYVRMHRAKKEFIAALERVSRRQSRPRSPL
jgi:RNA polymerase sigma-70 factor (ECF subfamily)